MKTRVARITITAVFNEEVDLEELGRSTLAAIQAPGTTFPHGMASLEILPLEEMRPAEPTTPAAPNTLN